MKSSDTPDTTQPLATAIARQYTIDELVHALRLIEHATAPTHDDGAHHEAAHQIATDALHGCSTTHPALKCPRCNGNSYVITVEGGMPGGAECPLCVGDGAPRNDAERAFVAALTTQPAMELPALPEPDIGLPWRHNAPDGSVHCSAFTRDKVLSIQREAFEAGRASASSAAVGEKRCHFAGCPHGAECVHATPPSAQQEGGAK